MTRNHNAYGLVGRGAVIMGMVALLVGAGGAAWGEQGVSTQDRQYLQKAHQSNLAEIAAGTLAQSKGANQQVKDIGAMLITDHTKLDDIVRQVASTAGVELPQTPDAEQRAMQAKLEKAPAGEFDAMFVAGQMRGHAKTLKLGTTETTSGSAAEVKKTATDAAPVIQAHHDKLMAAAQALGVPAMVDTGSGGTAATSAPDSVMLAVLAGAGVLLAAAGVFGLRRRRAHS